MRNKIIFITLFFIIGIWQNSIAENEAVIFQPPITNYTLGNNIFGAYGLVFDYNYHLGEDADAVAGTDVFAIGNGVIKRAQTQTGYGGVYIIEHTLVSGEKVCSLYGHLNISSFAKTVGQEVLKGEYLGEIGDYSQNGGWGEHIHLGIRKGAYPANPNAYTSCGQWIFSGYAPCEDILDDWYDPSIFISYIHAPMIFNYTFPNNSSEGWTEGTNVSFMSGGDTDSMYMNITGTNPEFISPAFCPTIYNANCPNVYADEVVIQFRAKVIGRSSSPTEPVTVYVKDQNASWANSLTLETISDSDYHYYVAYLSNITNASAKQVTQFSIELTEGSTSGNEYWEFDTVKVVYIGESTPLENNDLYNFKKQIQLPDMNSNNHDEIGILKNHPVTNQPTVTIYDSDSGEKLSEIYFFDSRIVPILMTKIPDLNDNGYPELKVIGYENLLINTKTEIRDAKSGTIIE